MTAATSIFLTVSPTKLDNIALILKSPTGTETVITNNDLVQAKNKGKVQIGYSSESSRSPKSSSRSSSKGTGTVHTISVYSSYRNAATNTSTKLTHISLLSLVLPAMVLVGATLSFFFTEAQGWDAIFPSMYTTSIAMKLAVWGTLILVVAYEQSHFWYGSVQKLHGCHTPIGLEVVVDTDGTDDDEEEEDEVAVVQSRGILRTPNKLNSTPTASPVKSNSSNSLTFKNGSEVKITSSPTKSSLPHNRTPSFSEIEVTRTSPNKARVSIKEPGAVPKDPPQNSTISNNNSSSMITAATAASTTTATTTTDNDNNETAISSPTSTTTSPQTIPFRFIRATKGDIAASKARWAETCAWRQKLGMDTVLAEPHPKIKVIKQNYPHYFHLRGKNNECCYYEKPPKMNLPELRKQGVQLEDLLRHYATCCEYMWTEIESSEDGKSIYVIDLDGIGIRDFAGEVVDFVKRASSFTADHYPERSGSIFIINVPSWFSVIWNVVKPMVDEVTKKKITIMRYGKEAITEALMKKIDIENIPPEYGGKSMPLGSSPEEVKFMEHFEKLNIQN
mmetsp:Transcript_444/g.623  ORF Transcript_444/g.623 Transcript_444/m.623 type:complete len:562 (+) Transcript_444:248-1933(+)